MVVLQSEDYDRLSADVVKQYFAGTPLNDALHKLASTMGLGPAQVRNLVWQCNTKTHLELFEKQAQAGADRMIEFPVADADYIIRRLYTPAEAQPLPVKTAEHIVDFYSDLPTTTEKVAETTCVDEKPVSDATKANRRGKSIRTMRKAASELEHHTYIEREGYMDALHQLAWNLRVNGGRDEFEKDAYALYGDAVLPIINDSRAVYRLEAITAEKVASPVERLVEADSDNFELLRSARNHYDEAIKYAQALSWLQTQLKDVL
jgi:hypothetical protein